MEGNDKDEQTAGGEADEAVYAEGRDGALRKSTEEEDGNISLEQRHDGSFWGIIYLWIQFFESDIK